MAGIDGINPNLHVFMHSYVYRAAFHSAETQSQLTYENEELTMQFRPTNSRTIERCTVYVSIKYHLSTRQTANKLFY